jgi:hypothetical protein
MTRLPGKSFIFQNAMALLNSTDHSLSIFAVTYHTFNNVKAFQHALALGTEPGCIGIVGYSIYFDWWSYYQALAVIGSATVLHAQTNKRG